MSVGERIKRFLAPPVFHSDEDKTQQAALLTIIVWVVLVSAFLGGMALGFLEFWTGFVPVLLLVAAGFFALLLVFLRLGWVRLVSLLVPLLLLMGFSIPAWRFNGLRDTAVLGYYLVIIVSALTSTQQVLALFTSLSVLSVIALYVAEINDLLVTRVALEPQPSDVIVLSLGLIASGLMLRSAVNRIATGYARARQSAQALTESNRQLQVNRDILTAQTQTLERRAHYLQASAVVAQEATASVSNLPQLLHVVAQTVGKQFGFYHVGLFLLESDGEWIKLQAAFSLGGLQMLAQGHRLSPDERCIVCWVVRQGKYCLARGAGEDAVPILANPYLPDTRSELALPLQIGDEVIGVLDVHSAQVDAFMDEDITALQALAGQIALAISNARLFQQVQANAEVERRAYGELSREAWQKLLRAQPDLGYLSDAQGERPAVAVLEPQMAQVLQTGQSAIEDSIVSIPIRLRGDVIGVVDGRKPDGANWSAGEIELLQAMTEQLNVALEGARLYQDTQRRAAREQLLGEVAGRVRESLDMEMVLKVATREIRRTMNLEKVVVRLASSDRLPSGSDTEEPFDATNS
jgi:GAF domain-containing protein